MDQPFPVTNLPPEYRGLRRPAPSTRLDAPGCLLVFGLIWTIFSAFGLVFGLRFLTRDYLDYKQLAQEGVTTSAKITHMWIDDSDDSSTYYVSYQFTVSIKGDPTRFESSHNVSSSFYKKHEISQGIEILYASSNPDLTAVKAEFGLKNLLGPALGLVVIFLFVLIGLVMLYVSVKAMNRSFLLRVNGRRTQAIVFDRWQEKDSEGDTVYFVAVAYQAPVSPKEHQMITYAEQNKTVYDKFQIGNGLIVRYLARNPSICQLLPEDRSIVHKTE